MELAAGILIGERYRLERLIGRGGMGVVWAAKDLLGHRAVALKFLHDAAGDPGAVGRLLREARAASAMRHPGIVHTHKVLELEDGSPVLVMELLTGESLRERLSRTPRMPLRELAGIMLPVLSAVGAAHAIGIVHRDLKPENIFVCRPPTGGSVVKLLDFGIAKMTALDEAAMRSTGNTTGAVLGTPTYMAPEQVFDDTDVDHRADIWALGLVIYECLSGVLPTKGSNVGQVLKHVVAKPFEPLEQIVPDLPASIAWIVGRMLERDRAHRAADLHEVLALFAPFARLHESTVEQRSRGSRATLGIPAVVVLGTAAALWFIPSASSSALEVPGSCPDGMVRIPAGTFQMGSPSGARDVEEQPQHEVELSGYCLDRVEVTVAAYQDCVNAGACKPTPPTVPQVRHLEDAVQTVDSPCNGPDRPNHPVNCVSWRQTAAYCQWRGKRLPTEAEWEYAARGSDGRRHPWGDEKPSAARLNASARTTVPVGQYPEGASPFGVLDMAGNVWEWTADLYAPYSATSATNPHGPATGKDRVARGGGWGDRWEGRNAATMRDKVRPMVHTLYLGFRCARGE